MDFKKHIPEIEKKLGYTFKDKSLLTQAFTRTSFCNEKNHRAGAEYMSNEVLEFFGDSVLSCSIVSLLLSEKTRRYEHGLYTELCEGDFSNIRSKLSDKRNLSLLTARLGIQRYLLVGEGDAKLGICDEPSVMGDLFESVIGAIYVDCGMDMQVMLRVVSGLISLGDYTTDTLPVQSSKNALQEWCADKKRRLPPPVYKTVSESGPDHKKVYERGCYIGDRLCGVGRGKNQKLADAAAAEAALEKLKSEEQGSGRTVTESVLTLKNMAAAKKLPTPEFRDLGQTPASTEIAPEFIVECRFSGLITSGIGRSKQEARAASAAAMLEALAPKKSAEKKRKPAAPARQKKPVAEPKAPHAAKKSDKQPRPAKRPHHQKKYQ